MSDEFKPFIPANLKPPTTAPVNPTVTSSTDISPSKIARVEPVTVEIDDSGAFKALTLEGRYRLAKYALASDMVPKSYKTPEQVMMGMEYAIELGFRPLTGLKSIAIINGTPSIFGDMPISLVHRSGLMTEFEEKTYSKDMVLICVENKNLDAKPWAASIRVKRKNGATVEQFFTMDDAKVAGLLDKSGPWRSYPRRMLQMRARSHALKDLFADVLHGTSIAEYDHNTMVDRVGMARTVENYDKPSGSALLKDALKK